jgi:hypothetical protein
MPHELRLDELLRTARGVDLPDAISAPKAAELAGDLGPSVSSFTRYSAIPKPEEWFGTAWGTRATDNRIIDPNSIMGIVRALSVNPRDVVLASATSAGIPGMWREPSEIARTRLWLGWDTLTDDRWSVIRKVGVRLTEDQAREEETAQLKARNTELERRVAELERSTSWARRV